MILLFEWPCRSGGGFAARAPRLFTLLGRLEGLVAQFDTRGLTKVRTVCDYLSAWLEESMKPRADNGAQVKRRRSQEALQMSTLQARENLLAPVSRAEEQGPSRPAPRHSRNKENFTVRRSLYYFLFIASAVGVGLSPLTDPLREFMAELYRCAGIIS